MKKFVATGLEIFQFDVNDVISTSCTPETCGFGCGCLETCHCAPDSGCGCYSDGSVARTIGGHQDYNSSN